jgi:hypothetical protein
MGRKACLNIGANNYGFDNNGNYQEDAFINVPEWCTYDDPMDADEEQLAEDIGSEDFTSHEEAYQRGLEDNESDWKKHRDALANADNLPKLGLLGLGLLAVFGGVL